MAEAAGEAGARRIAVILKGYPRLSETFIAQEVLGLEKSGLALELWALRHPTDQATHPIHDEIAAPVRYLPEYLHREPWRVLKGLAVAAGMQGFWPAFGTFMRDFLRDPTPNRGRRFGQAAVLARELPPEIRFLYVHFLHTPASVARYAALFRGLSWACSAHAKDIWTTKDWEKREKLAAMRWLVTCTGTGARHLTALAPDPERVSLVYHGLDLARFPDPGPRPAPSAGATATLLSVGRLVEKKGYDDLLAALASLPPDLDWRFVHIGGGDLRDRLRARARDLGIAERIEWRGAQPQNVVLEAYRAADLFVLPSKIAGDGDRDGIPNVLMEAQSQRLACLSTAVSAIPELIEDGATGVLVPPGDVPALSTALERLLREPELRDRLGNGGRARLEAYFRHETGVAAIAERLRAAEWG